MRGSQPQDSPPSRIQCRLLSRVSCDEGGEYASQHDFWALQQNLPAVGSEPQQYLTCWVRGCLLGPAVALALRSPGSARLGAPQSLLGPPVRASS